MWLHMVLGLQVVVFATAGVRMVPLLTFNIRLSFTDVTRFNEQ